MLPACNFLCFHRLVEVVSAGGPAGILFLSRKILVIKGVL